MHILRKSEHYWEDSITHPPATIPSKIKDWNHSHEFSRPAIYGVNASATKASSISAGY